MSDNQLEKDRFKFKTWVIPLPDYQFVHQTYNEGSDHRDFFGRDKETQDLVEVLRNDKWNVGCRVWFGTGSKLYAGKNERKF